MTTFIIPLVKNKSSDTSNVNNYIPIVLVTVDSKILEDVMLGLIDSLVLRRYILLITEYPH